MDALGFWDRTRVLPLVMLSTVVPGRMPAPVTVDPTATSVVVKPALSRGELQCIGATTLDEYRKYIEKDAALARRFQTVMVEPPNPEEAVVILKGLRGRYEEHHRVKITDEALGAAVELSQRYITGRCLPDKAIDVIDEAGARIRLRSMVRPPDLKELEDEAEKLNQSKEEAVANQDFELAASLRDQADKLRKKKEVLTQEWRDKAKQTGPEMGVWLCDMPGSTTVM